MYSSNVIRLGRLPRIALVAAGLALGSWGAQAQDTVKIGFLGPLSGGDAEQGISARNGFQLAVDQANHADLPFKIEPVILDDAANPQTGVAAALKLTNDPEVVAATGHWNSGVALATIPVFSRANIPFIVWGAISPKITEKSNPMVTRVVPTLTNTNAPLAKWAAAQLGKKIAIVSDTTDYGLANVKSFDKFFTEAGGTIVATETAPVGTTDFRTVLTKIKAERARCDLFWRCRDRGWPRQEPDGRAWDEAAHDRRRWFLRSGIHQDSGARG